MDAMKNMEAKYPLVCRSIEGCFSVKMDLDNTLHSVLNAKETPYDFEAEDFDSPRFWTNTQFLIYHVCEREESLMGILFNKLKKRISLFFECSVDSKPGCEFRYDPERKYLFVKAVYPDTFDDSAIYGDTAGRNLSSIEQLVRYGYDHAKIVQADVTAVKRSIENTINDIHALVLKDGFLKGEKWEDFKHLLRVALAYGFPTKEFPTKKFCALTKDYYTVKNEDVEEELSCGGEFIVWEPGTELLPLYDFRLGTDVPFMLQYSEFQNEVLLRGARETTLQMTKIVRKATAKSAKAAIMSRNMSHNLGSHVMAYLKNDLRSIPAIFDSAVLHDLFPQAFLGDFPQAFLDKLASIRGSVEMPFLVGLGQFIGYLQERQDYIATIASGYVPSFSPVNFKDAVYDELNPDKRFERHHQSDAENHNRPQNILLSYIAKSEKLSRIESDGGQTHDILLGFKSGDAVFWGTTEVKNDPALSSLRRFNLALPGGIVGRQAIFSIVENIIRNAAKHNNVEGNLELVFECIDGKEFEKDPEQFAGSITDANLRKQYAQSTDIPDLLILSITDNLPCEGATIEKLKEALAQPYVGKDEHANRGIKEIRISATWLRGEEDESVFAPCPPDGDPDWQPVEGMKAPVVAIERADGHLRYFIGLRKTYEFALVHANMDTLSAEEARKRKEELISKFQIPTDSYVFLSVREIQESDTCYEFIIAENSAVYGAIRPKVTNRCLDLTAFRKQSGIRKCDIYAAYTGISEDSDDCIHIQDEKTHGIEFTRRIKFVDPHMSRYADLSATDPAADFNTILGNGVRYLYRSHHASEANFKAYWKSKAQVLEHALQKGRDEYERACSQVVCIDSISGDNSSDRLVRRESLNERWFYNHLYALQSKVAIFDERLFQIVHGLDESQLVSGSFLSWSLKESCVKGEWPATDLSESELDALAENLSVDDPFEGSQFSELYGRCLSAKDDQEARKELIAFLEKYEFRISDDVVGKSHLTAAYAEKGIDVFTIIPAGRNLCYVVGCKRFEYALTADGEPSYVFRFVPIAELSLNSDSGEFSCDWKISPVPDYRYLSIHQGLVDKIYEEFKLSEKEAAKRDVIKELYAKFTGTSVGDNQSFLERLTIHSGRGNITEKDMPMKLPFLQYSAVEHAVLDCKYSLVELLDYAKYKEVRNAYE